MTTNEKSTETIIEFLGRQIANGEPVPTFRSEEFAELIAAARAIAEQGHAATYEVIGRRALEVVLCCLSASMHGERAVALMRDMSRPL